MVKALAATQATNSTPHQSPHSPTGVRQRVKSLADILADTGKTMVIFVPQSGQISLEQDFPVCDVPRCAATRTLLTTAEQEAVLTLTELLLNSKVPITPKTF